MSSSSSSSPIAQVNGSPPDWLASSTIPYTTANVTQMNLTAQLLSSWLPPVVIKPLVPPLPTVATPHNGFSLDLYVTAAHEALLDYLSIAPSSVSNEAYGAIMTHIDPPTFYEPFQPSILSLGNSNNGDNKHDTIGAATTAAAASSAIYHMHILYNMTRSYHLMPMLQNMIINAQLGLLYNIVNYTNTSTTATAARTSVSAVNAPFEYEAGFEQNIAGGLFVALLLGLAFSYVPIGFGASIMKETEAKARHQQKVMGM
jgi:hypothetical protein